MGQGDAGVGAPVPDRAESAPPPAEVLQTEVPQAEVPQAEAPSAQPLPAQPLPARPLERRSERVGPTRLSGAWTAAVGAIVLVVAMLIFILQNGREVPINFVSAHGHLPLGVALLFAAGIGALIVVGCGAARILQLRRVAKRRTRAAAAVPGLGSSTRRKS